MRLFSEEVTPTFTNSNLNIITVKDFYEVFFDVYELEINGKKYIAEKVAEYKGSPVISTSIIIDNKEYTGNFVLNRGKFEILVNKESLTYQQNVDDDFTDLLSENYKTDEVDELILEKRDTIIEDIQNAKLSAKKYINKLKQQQIQETTKIHQEKLNEFNAELKEIQQGLVEEFVRVVSNVRSDISLANDNTSEKLKKFITGKVTILAESLENNLENKVEELETFINERVNSIASDIVSGVIATEIKSSNTRLDENIDGLFNHINLKLTELVKEHEVLTSEKVSSIISAVDDKLIAIDQVNIELNNSIQKSSNKALSRIGNVKIKLEEDIAKNVTIIQHDIDKASERIKVYYDGELNKLNEAVNTLSDETKQECVKLISESRDSLLQVIGEIKTDVPNIIIEKKDGTGKEIDLKKVKSELEKSITTRFSTELMSLKRMMEMMSGGGSVAKQFADGGTMNGNLTVVGAISASQYLGLPGGGGGVSGDYLPLSGGTVNGFLTVTDSVNFDGGVDFNTFVSNDITLRGNNNVTLRATDLLGLSSANTININAPNITLSGSSVFSGLVEQRDGTVPQELRVYRTYSSGGSNYERLTLKYDAASTSFTVGSENAGTGTARTLNLQTGGVTRLSLPNHAFTNSVFVMSSEANNTSYIAFGGGTARITRIGNGGFTMADSAGSGPMLSLSRGLNITGSGYNNITMIGDDAASWFTSRGGTVVTRHNVANSGASAHTTLRVQGGTSIGRTYYDTTPPTDGLIVQGNAGIGTVSPNEKLTVVGNISAVGRLFLDSGTNAARALNIGTVSMFSRTANIMSFFISNANILEIFSGQLRTGTQTISFTPTSNAGVAADCFISRTGVGSFAFGTTAGGSEASLSAFSVNLSGDIEVSDPTRGVILKSPNGTRFRITVGNDGALTTTVV